MRIVRTFVSHRTDEIIKLPFPIGKNFHINVVYIVWPSGIQVTEINLAKMTIQVAIYQKWQPR